MSLDEERKDMIWETLLFVGLFICVSGLIVMGILFLVL